MAARPRILMLSAYYFPFQGGSETHARTVATSLHAAGFDVRIVTRRDDRQSPRFERVDDIPVHRVRPAGPRTGLRKWAMLPFALVELVKRRQSFDVIYCPGFQGIGLAAIAAARLLRCPVILRSGNLGVLEGQQWNAPLARWHIPADSAPARWLKAAVRRLYLRADAIVCNSRANEDEARRYGVPDARRFYLPNAVDPAHFRPAENDEGARIRLAEKWPLDAWICVYVGRLSREKGVMDLLEAWRQIENGRSRVLVLIGPDMPGPLDVGPAARAFVAAHGLRDAVIFHGESTDTARLLRAADAYVQPSHYESFSNALIEAMATGLPTAASRVGGMLDCVVDAENGLLFSAGDPADIARALRELLADPARSARLGARARETVVAHFNHATIMQAFADLFVATADRGAAPLTTTAPARPR